MIEFIYAEMVADVDFTIHDAWQVDFDLSLDFWKWGHIQGVQNMADVSTKSAHGARIFIVSSVGAAVNWTTHNEGPVSEEVINESTVPQGMGYVESKHVSAAAPEYGQH